MTRLDDTTHAHLAAARILAQGLGTTTADVVRQVVDELLTIGYHSDHTVTTRGELYALPPGSVVRTHTDPAYVCERLSDGWFTTLHDRPVHPNLPATVIYTPED